MAVADAIDDVMDESSESHDDDDDEEEDEESAAIARVAELKSQVPTRYDAMAGLQFVIDLCSGQLSFNPSYETFDAYIQALRSAMQFDELGAVRQEMASRFPLEPRNSCDNHGAQNRVSFPRNRSVAGMDRGRAAGGRRHGHRCRPVRARPV